MNLYTGTITGNTTVFTVKTCYWVWIKANKRQNVIIEPGFTEAVVKRMNGTLAFF